MTGDQVDLLLIGSGVAAAALAKRLLDQDPSASILMLEAGDRIPARDRSLWWHFVTTGKLPYDYTLDDPASSTSTGMEWQVHGTRIAALGGTTMHWGGWSLRLKPEDFHLWSNTGTGGDWLVDYDALEGYYCQAEDFMAVGGDDPWVHRSRPLPMPSYPVLAADVEFRAAFDAFNVRHGKMPLARYRQCMTTGTCRYCPLGARFNAQYVTEDIEARRHPHFELRTGAAVTRLLLDGTRRVSGAEYVDLATRKLKKVEAATVIVCAGAYESPKILMASRGPGHPTGIGNAYDLLGRYLVSHSFLSVSGVSRSNPDKLTTEFGFPTFMSREYDSEERQSTGKIFMFRNESTPGQKWEWLMQRGMSRSEIDAIATGPRTMGLSAFIEEAGSYFNRIEIGAGAPDAFLRAPMRITYNRAKGFEENANRRLSEMSKFFSAMNAYPTITTNIEGAAGFHASGTCRMAETPDQGVTDGDLRVHGMDNLYVLSNAVFPSVGAVNPTLTLVALAFRLADHLDGGLQAAGRARAASPAAEAMA
jgi:choline dehydrogenase-like flavoprotein